MRNAPGRQRALCGHRAKVLQAHAKAFRPRAVVAHKAFGQTRAARGEAGIKSTVRRGLLQIAGLGGQPTGNALAHGLGPVGIGHGGAAAAVHHGQKIDQALQGALLRVQQQHGGGPAGHQGGRAAQHFGMQLGKSPSLPFILQRHGIAALLRPVGQRAMHQRPKIFWRLRFSHGARQSASQAYRAPRCAR